MQEGLLGAITLLVQQLNGKTKTVVNHPVVGLPKDRTNAFEASVHFPRTPPIGSHDSLASEQDEYEI